MKQVKNKIRPPKRRFGISKLMAATMITIPLIMSNGWIAYRELSRKKDEDKGSGSS